jgi:predicted  nucleic acid-binding Zn-ribbon protein
MPKTLNAQQNYNQTLTATEKVLQNLLGYSKTLEQRLVTRQKELTQLSDQLGMVSEELKKARSELEDSRMEVQVISDLLKKSQDKQKKLSEEFETYRKDSQKTISSLILERDAAITEAKIYKGATVGITVVAVGAGVLFTGKYILKWW